MRKLITDKSKGCVSSLWIYCGVFAHYLVPTLQYFSFFRNV